MDLLATSIIIDIETLDTTPTSVITEISAIAFNRMTFTEEACFTCTPSILHQLAAGRTTSAATIHFHHSKGTLPKNCPHYLPKDAVHALSRFLRDFPPHLVWIQGPDFDRPILESFCQQSSEPLPWEFWRTRDTRTTWDLAFPGEKHPPRRHHAINDCRDTLADLHKSLFHLGRPTSA